MTPQLQVSIPSLAPQSSKEKGSPFSGWGWLCLKIQPAGEVRNPPLRSRGGLLILNPRIITSFLLQAIIFGQFGLTNFLDWPVVLAEIVQFEFDSF